MSSHTRPLVETMKWRAVIHFSLEPGVFPGGLTSGAGTVGHPGDESLLFAGRLSPVALVLVGVSV